MFNALYRRLDALIDLLRGLVGSEKRRPCEVAGQRCWFHCFTEVEDGLLKINAFVTPDEQASIVQRFKQTNCAPSYCSVEKLRAIKAVVEYPDGTVNLVQCQAVRFLDTEEV